MYLFPVISLRGGEALRTGLRVQKTFKAASRRGSISVSPTRTSAETSLCVLGRQCCWARPRVCRKELWSARAWIPADLSKE